MGYSSSSKWAGWEIPRDENLPSSSYFSRQQRLRPRTARDLTIYSHCHHTYSMCISTVHYCCHRNVMHSVSYKLKLSWMEKKKSRLKCSGSLIFILSWKGFCKYGRKERRGKRLGRGGVVRGGAERGDQGGWILPSRPVFTSLPLPPQCLRLFSLTSVLSTGSRGIRRALAVLLNRSLAWARASPLSASGSGGGRQFFSRAMKWQVFTMCWHLKKKKWKRGRPGPWWVSSSF